MSLILLSILVLEAITLGGSFAQDCPCHPNNTLRVSNCRDTIDQSRHRNLPHNHIERGLYGDCLPKTPANTKTCFKWKTKFCLKNEGEEETCRIARQDKHSTSLTEIQRGRQISSPGLNKKRYYNRYFCVYNVTLDCPGHAVELTKTARTIGLVEGCEDYLAIYTDPTQSEPQRKLCGYSDFTSTITLNTNSFIAVFWTNYPSGDETNSNRGGFEMDARCGAEIVPTIATEEEQEEDDEWGSGRSNN